MTTLVIGATGKVGRHVTAQLAERGLAVRALVRRPDQAGLPESVEQVHGDLSDLDSLRAAAHGADSVFLMWPLMSADPAARIAATLAESTRRLVLLSSAAARSGRDDAISRVHLAVEQAVERTALEWTFLQPHGFAANTLGWARQIREDGVVRGAYGSVVSTLIHEADMAAVAVTALAEDGHVGAKYDLTGPQALSHVDQVRVVGEVIGRPIRWEEVSRAAAREQLVKQIPAAYADAMLDAYARLSEAEPDQPTATVAQVTGRPARSYAQWVADHAAEFTGQ
ncbi:NAD(P)H-binding protein [Amycolatopsis benzoatilytica]|uniref:NAD(P)H-binding protein n=1 Tax=Amycolatopsis benzoatilytica TaxID=346045 RepID=UPI000369279F|nr:NAD(P)H-binding protein [Amycolatopsis benzoatilytica]